MKAWQVARLRRDRQMFSVRRTENSRMMTGFGGLLLTALLGLFAMGSAAGAAVALYSANAGEFEAPEEALARLPKGGAKIYDRHGTLLYEFVDQFNGLRRPIQLTEMSDWVLKATIAVEDPNFYDNIGVNFRGLARAGYENFVPQDGDEFLQGSGGSSITQQLAKNVYIPREQRAERSVARKMRETVIALELTDRYEKDQILEWYLNTIPYGGIYVGIEAAADGYFGKPAKDLTLAEAALLAGIPQAPARYDPMMNFELAKARQEEVLRLMVNHGAITQTQADRAVAEELVFRQRRFTLEAPHFVLGQVADEIRRRFGERALYDDGLEVITTLDLSLQNTAAEILEKWISEHEERTNSRNGALMAMRPQTGEVLVYLGSRDYGSDHIQGNVDNIPALNSPGSTLKPFTYMAAFSKGWGTGTPIPDVPIAIRDPGTGQAFSPTNPGKRYHGLVSVAEALGSSLNIPALQAIMFAGVDDTVEMLKKVGYTTFNDRSRIGPALTLGGTDIRLQESVIAYSVLATGGVMRGVETARDRHDDERQIDPVVLLKVTNSEGEVLYEFTQPAEQRVVPESLAYMATSILMDGANTHLTFATPNALALRNGMPAAVKTGTSEPFADSEDIGETWTLGYTTELVVGIWAGNTDNAPIRNIFSTTIAWNAWNEFMVAAHEALGLEGKPFQKPAGLVERQVNGRTSLFLEGVQPITGAWWLDGRHQINFRGGVPDLNTLARVRSGEEAPDGETETLTQTQQGQQGQQAPSSAPTALSITSPGNGQVVSGQVAITGVATSANFVGYVVDVLQGGSGARLVASQSPGGGVLAVWNTGSMPNGTYVIRLIVQDAQRGTLQTTVTVTVQN
jgi:membrane peptidoglycan carboxypeptidase